MSDAVIVHNVGDKEFIKKLMGFYHLSIGSATRDSWDPGSVIPEFEFTSSSK